MVGQRIMRRVRARGKPRAHLIHIGKTAGTALKWALRPAETSGTYRIVLHEHADALKDIPEGDKVFFVVRDPIERYVSGFYSRQRQGRPRYDYPWSPDEAVAFETFPSADALARALVSPDEQEREAATHAMRSIQHVRDSYWRWFHDPEYFARRSGDVLMVISSESLNASFPRLCELLGVEGVSLPTDEVKAHRNPSVDRRLSDEARANLREWYAEDYAFIDACAALPGFAGERPPAATEPTRGQGRG